MHFTPRKGNTWLALGYALVAPLFAASIGVGLFQVGQSQAQLTHTAARDALQARLVATMQTSVSDRVGALQHLALASNADVIRAESNRIVELEGTYSTAMAALAKTLDEADAGPEAKVLFDKLQDQEREALPMLAEAEWLGIRKSVQTRHVLVQEVVPQQTAWFQALDDLSRSEQQHNARTMDAARAALREALVLAGGLALLALAIGAATAFFMRRAQRVQRVQRSAPQTILPGANPATIMQAGPLTAFLKEFDEFKRVS